MTSLASPAAVPVVSVTGLIKQYGRFAALHGVTADFAGERIYAILGDNGAGKTTLLRTLAGLTAPTRGTVRILGSEVLRSVCHDVGYMAHPSLLYDELSALENLRYFARLYGVNDGARCDDHDSAGWVGSSAVPSRRTIFARHAAAPVVGAGADQQS